MREYTSILMQADIFYQFSTTQLEMVASLCQERAYSTGEIILLEGSESDELYIIAAGSVEILFNPAIVSDQPHEIRPPVTIAQLHRGQSFGEIALVDRGIRSATVRAAHDPTRLLIIPGDKLRDLCHTDTQLGYLLMRNLAADLGLKIRSAGLRMRQELLFSQKHK